MVCVVLGIIWSCNKEEDILSKNQHPELNYQNDGQGMTKLGKKLENPYSVENMKKAYKNLQSSNAGLRVNPENIEISTTHLYLKFKPKNETELAILKRDSTIIWYEYPLDYEIIAGGSSYHDPAVPVGTPTYQYASIPVNHKIPEGVAYELLSDLFIPDEYKDDESTTARIANSNFVEMLVDEALSITNNMEEVTHSNQRIQGGSWRPAGKMRVWDDVVNSWRPIEGLQVNARRWFTTHTGNTNVNGDYSCDGKFKRDANYKLDWERYNFALREGWLNGANIDGPKKEGNWNLDLSSGKNMFHARVFMAAYHYYYKDIKGLRRPPENAILKTQMHIRCYNESDPDINGNHSAGRRFLGLGSALHIYSPDRPMNEIYGTTIHELAHASHWSMTRSDYNNAEDIVVESWARGVQWELTRMIWLNYNPYYGRKKLGNTPNQTSLYNYTGIVQDMIDNISGYDQVEGYTIKQIEDALDEQRTWGEWRNNIINKYNNATENNLSNLFDYWN